MILSIIWTLKGNYAGTTLGIGIGIFLFVFGLTTFFQLGQTDGLIADGIRGLLTAILGYLAYLELKNKKENV